MDSGDWKDVIIASVFWGFVLAVCILPIYFRYREKKQVHETLRSIVSQGGTVSDEMLKSLQSKPEGTMPQGSLATNIGIILVSVGIGIVVFAAVLAGAFWYNGITKAATIAGPIIASGGVITGVLGGAFLLIGRRTANTPPKDV